MIRFYGTGARGLAAMLLCIFLGIGLTTSNTAFANVLTQPLTPVDRDIPDFSLVDIDGAPVNPETLAGKTWLINFWAVWCAPCLDELPELNGAWAQLQNHNVGMLAINIGEPPDKIETFLAKHNLQIDFPIVIGDKIKSLSNWSGRGLPYTVIVNPHGKVVYEATGPREWDKPEFINAILEVEATAMASRTLKGRVASVLGWYHALAGWQKVGIVIGLLVLAGLLFYLIRQLHKAKPPTIREQPN